MIYESLNLAVLSHIPASASRILDLGCGTGNLGHHLLLGPHSQVVGVTFSEEEAVQARRRLTQVIVADLDTYEPEGSLGKFDVVICSHILEHLSRPERLLRLIAPLIASDGRLIVALPNILHWKQRLRFVCGNFKYTHGGLMDSTHLRFFDWNTAQQLLSMNGYTLLSAVADGVFPIPIIRHVLPGSLTKRMDNLAVNMLPGIFGGQFVIHAKPQVTQEI